MIVFAGCGGNGTTTTDKVASARWAAGLRAWGSGLNSAIDGISILFSRPVDVRGIETGSPQILRLLRRYERTLAACSARVGRLGAPPASLVLAKREALHACISLERAARLVRNGVRAFQDGLGSELLNATGEPLTAGQDGVRRAQLDLVQR